MLFFRQENNESSLTTMLLLKNSANLGQKNEDNHVIKQLTGIFLCATLVACQGTGPRTRAIVESPDAVVISAEKQEPFLLIETNRAVADKVAASHKSTKTTNFLVNEGAGPVVIGVGDVLDIAIVSTNANGFIDFTQSSVSPVSSTPLPPQTVSSDGMVNVPPIGRVNARGQSVQQFESFLTRRLGEVLVEPSVIVNLTERNSAQVNVLGDVTAPGRYPITQDGRHLIDAISAAGGPINRPEDSQVTVDRKGKIGKVAADRLLANPRYNIHLQPNDVITVTSARNIFTVLGASSENQTVTFSKDKLTLAEALGSAGGLQNRRADKSGVFLFREIPTRVAKTLGAGPDQFTGDTVPAVFQFDLAEPTSLFTVGKFIVESGDIIYISESITEEVNGALSAFTAFVPAPVEYVRAETIN